MTKAPCVASLDTTMKDTMGFVRTLDLYIYNNKFISNEFYLELISVHIPRNILYLHCTPHK